MSCARITDSDTHLTTMSRRMQLGEQFRCQNFGHSCPSSLGPEANGEASKKSQYSASRAKMRLACLLERTSPFRQSGSALAPHDGRINGIILDYRTQKDS